ncbi:MAG TPA: hypothetical protein VIL30_23730 [Ramlibacter sp.]|jgi:hypothetical protein
MKRLLKAAAAALLLAVLTTGCAVNRATATVEPGANLATLKSFHVKPHDKDDGKVYDLIADNLRKRGHQVSVGAQPAGPVDATVTYVDKWMWDITMYMLELTINFREPRTDFPLATGNSYHTSLTRLSPTEMVNEVLTNMLKKEEKK